MCATYHPSSQNHNHLFDNIGKGLHVYTTYESVDLAGDYNVQVGEKLFDTFLYQHELTSINKNPTCYKNPNNPSCIDHVLNKSPKMFSRGSQIFINWFYLFLSYIFQKRRRKRYRTGILKISKRTILIGIFRTDFQQNQSKNIPLLKKHS